MHNKAPECLIEVFNLIRDGIAYSLGDSSHNLALRKKRKQESGIRDSSRTVENKIMKRNRKGVHSDVRRLANSSRSLKPGSTSHPKNNLLIPISFAKTCESHITSGLYDRSKWYWTRRNIRQFFVTRSLDSPCNHLHNQDCVRILYFVEWRRWLCRLGELPLTNIEFNIVEPSISGHPWDQN